MSWSANVTHISGKMWGVLPHSPTPHCPPKNTFLNHYEIILILFSRLGGFREEAAALKRPPPSTPCWVHPYSIAMHYQVNQPSTAQWSPYVSPVQHSTILRSAPTVYFVWIWEQTAIISLYSIDWLVFITETECVYCAERSTFYVLPTQCIYVFCVDLRTNSDYFTVQHWLVGFYNWDGVCLLRGTFYILRSAHTVCLWVLCGSENKQRLFHCTALTGWFL